MKRTIWIFIAVFAVAWAGCRKEKSISDVVSKTLSACRVIDEFSDSSFVPRRVVCIDANQDHFYCTDYSAGYFVLDKDFNLIKRVGIVGQGPADFLGSAHFYMQNDSLYIWNDGKQAIQLFVNDKHEKQIAMPKGLSFSPNTCFFVENQQIYHSVRGDTLPVVAFDENSIKKTYLCRFTSQDDVNFKLHSARHIIKAKNGFYVIGSALPIFQKYDFDGKLLETYNMEKLPEIRQQLQWMKSQEKVPNAHFTMCQDVFYDEGKLFLLAATNIHQDYWCNTVYVFDVAENIEHIATLKLGSGRAYGSFCVKSDTLLAHNMMDASLDVYNIKSSK